MHILELHFFLTRTLIINIDRYLYHMYESLEIIMKFKREKSE